MSAPGDTAIVAGSHARAKRLRDVLGIDTRWLFSPRSAASFEGLRASLVLIDATATIPDTFMATIRANVLKMPGGGGKIVLVDARDITKRDAPI